MSVRFPTSQFAPETLQLADAEPIGMGNRRRVFQHPDNPDLCIKIARTEHIRAQMDARGPVYRLMPTRWRDDNWLEARAYQQAVLLLSDERIWAHLPKLYGWQNTDIGAGLVFDYYCDAAGQPAPTLRRALQENGLTNGLGDALQDLNAYIRTAGIWMRHPNVDNVVLAQDGRLKLIDCLGTYNMHVLRYIPILRTHRYARHISYLDKQVKTVLSQISIQK